MSANTPGDRLMRDLRGILDDEDAELPPPVVRTMEAEVEAWETGRRIVLAFPTDAQYAGPTGFVQGGFLATALDNAFGPVAYTAVGEPVVSVGLSVSFVRPLPVSLDRFDVEAVLVDATRRFAFVRGEARIPDGRLVAAATSELVVPSTAART